jgi:hypothetical protein
VHHRRRSFTVVELLVVVAIISVLIALVFPVLARARRAALVLACPIAYVGQNGAVYLTNLNGSAELQISPPGWWVRSQNWLQSPMAWSPSGERLGFEYSTRAGQGGVAFMHVMSGRITGGPWGHFGGWVDNNLYMESGAWSHRVLSADTGRMVSSFRLPDDRHYDTLAPVPLTSDGSYVASIHGDIYPYIGLVGKDFMPRRAIYTWKGFGHVHLTPRVDPMGECAAWSTDGRVFTHSLRAHPSTPASAVQLPNEYLSAEFCDWTEDSRLLINAKLADGSAVLVVTDVYGRGVRKIPTTVPPMPYSVAPYRKYEHR